MNKLVLFIFTLTILSASCTVNKAVVKKESLQVNSNSNSSSDDKEEYAAFFKAEKARLLGDNSEAKALYLEFVKKYKTNATAFYNLANLHMQSFELSKAERYAAEAVRLDGDNKYFAERYADILSRNKKGAQAASIYKRLVQNNPKTSESYLYKQYFIYKDLQEYDKAIEVLNQIEGKMGVSEEVVLQKVDLLQRDKKTKQAVSEVQKLLKLDPNNSRYKAIIADIYEKSGDKAKAKEIFGDLIDNNPDDPKAQMALANYHYKKGDTVKYKQALKNLMANKNLDAKYKINLLLPLLSRANDSAYASAEILPLVKTMKESNPDSKDAKEMYAEILFYSNRHDEAVEEYRDFIENDKSNFDSWMNLMLAYTALSRQDSVVKVADEALDYFPNNPALYFFKGTALTQLGENEKCIEAMNSALDLEPESEMKVQIYSAMGDAYFNEKDHQNSDLHFDKALEIKEDPTTLNNYAYYLSLRKDKLDKALKMSKRSLELRPGSATFLDTYGWIYYMQGDYENARLQLEKAMIADQSKDGTIIEHLGDAYFKLNNLDKAKKLWSEALQKGGGSDFLRKKVLDGTLYE